MSPTTIKARADREAMLHDTARQIREMLDAVRDRFAGEEDEVEERVIELVTGEDEP